MLQYEVKAFDDDSQIHQSMSGIPRQLYSFDKSGFYADAKARVRAHFGDAGLKQKAYKACSSMAIKGSMTCALWLSTYYFAFVSDVWETMPLVSEGLLRAVLATLSGLLFIMAGFQIMHDASHYALFSSA